MAENKKKEVKKEKSQKEIGKINKLWAVQVNTVWRIR